MNSDSAPMIGKWNNLQLLVILTGQNPVEAREIKSLRSFHFLISRFVFIIIVVFII
jgi:hypothetical protein